MQVAATLLLMTSQAILAPRKSQEVPAFYIESTIYYSENGMLSPPEKNVIHGKINGL